MRRHVDRLTDARGALEDQRVLLLRYRAFFQAFESLIGHERTWPDGQAFYVVSGAGAGAAAAELKRSLETTVEGEVELLHRALPSGEWAVLILVSARAAPRVSALLSASRVEELPMPAGLRHTNLLRAPAALKARLAAIPGELGAIDGKRRALGLAEAAEQAAGHFETLIEQLLDAAPQEHLMRRLGQALSRTTRLANTLDEREREEHLRVKRLMARRRAGPGL